MADLFEQLCKGLTSEQVEKLRRDDLPIGKDAGTFEMTEEEKRQEQEDLHKFIERRKEAIRKRKEREEAQT